MLRLKKIIVPGVVIVALAVALLLKLGVTHAASSSPVTPCGQWNVVPSPNPGTYNVLDGVAAIGIKDIWAVGYSDNQTLTVHWNGTNWSVVPSANASTQDFLDAATAISTNNVWAVGYYVNVLNNTQTLTEQWNGTSWIVALSMTPGVSGQFTAVAAIPGGNKVWAVGHYTDSSSIDHTLIEQRNGTSWVVVPSPDAGVRGSDLLGVTALSANDAWAVGTYSDSSGNFHALTEHWNGNNWKLVTGPQIANNGVLWSVSPIPGTNTVVAAGTYVAKNGFNQTLTAFWDGEKWVVVSSPNVKGANNIFFGVVALNVNDAWAVGATFTNTGPDQTFSEHWNGKSWSIVPTPDPSGSGDLTAVTRVPGASLVWTVGVSLGSGHTTLTENYCSKNG